MARRRTRNQTGIPRDSSISAHHAWVTFVCVQCGHLNHVNCGASLPDLDYMLDSTGLVCESCGFVHATTSPLPFSKWAKGATLAETPAAENFWRGFFRSIVEEKKSFWKQCNTCGRILPNSHFSRHAGWGPLEKQMECRACKGAINALLNPLRTPEQHHESSLRRRLADLLFEGEDQNIDIDDLFDRFGSKCFKTKRVLSKHERSTWHIDHILPSRWLYPLTKDNAALLSSEANESKNDRWPSQYYTNNELIELSRITGANLDLLSQHKPVVNRNIDANLAVDRYLQVRDGSDLQKRIAEIRGLLIRYGLDQLLDDEHRHLIGLD